MPIDPIKWVEDRAAENSVKDRRNGGRKANWRDRFVGNLIGADVEGAVDDDYAYSQNTDALEVLEGTGNSRSQLGLGEGNLTPEQVRGAKANYDKSETERMLRDAEGRQTRATAQLQAPGLEEARSTNQRLLQQGNNQMTLATAQMQQNSNQFMAQMADSKDQRAMELQMRREDMDRLDRRDEKNRRRESIQALIGGLSSLGAAFAV